MVQQFQILLHLRPSISRNEGPIETVWRIDIEDSHVAIQEIAHRVAISTESVHFILPGGCACGECLQNSWLSDCGMERESARATSHRLPCQEWRKPFEQDVSCSGKIGALSLLYAFGYLARKQKSDVRVLCVCTLGVTDGNWRGLPVRKYLRMCRNGGVSYHTEDFAYAAVKKKLFERTSYLPNYVNTCFYLYKSHIIKFRVIYWDRQKMNRTLLTAIKS